MSLVSGILGLGNALITRLFPDKEKQAEAQLRLLELQQQGQLAELEAGMKAVVAEAQSESWLARNWRPITMLSFVAIVANNYLLHPYLSLFWSSAPLLETPEQLWGLIQMGLGGYVVGRSAEKCVKAWKEKH